MSINPVDVSAAASRLNKGLIQPTAVSGQKAENFAQLLNQALGKQPVKAVQEMAGLYRTEPSSAVMGAYAAQVDERTKIRRFDDALARPDLPEDGQVRAVSDVDSTLVAAVDNDEILLAQAVDPDTAPIETFDEALDAVTPTEAALQADNVNEVGLAADRLNVTPFQLFIDRAVEALEGISQMEFRVNDLIQEYIAGRVSVEEVSIETTKLQLAITFASSVVNAAKDTFKEILQTQI